MGNNLVVRMITTYHQGEMTVIRGRDKPRMIVAYYNKKIDWG